MAEAESRLMKTTSSPSLLTQQFSSSFQPIGTEYIQREAIRRKTFSFSYEKCVQQRPKKVYKNNRKKNPQRVREREGSNVIQNERNKME